MIAYRDYSDDPLPDEWYDEQAERKPVRCICTYACDPDCDAHSDEGDDE